MLTRIKKLQSYSKNISVLYIEDSLEPNKNTIEFLKEIFHNLIIASDGEDGLKKFQKNRIDLVITNINIPKLNGIEMIKKIQKLDKNCFTLVFSTTNEPDTLLQIIKLKVDGYLLKPFGFDALLDILENIIDEIRQRYEARNYKYYLEQYSSIIDKNNIVLKINTDGIITYVNDIFCNTSGFKREETIGKKNNIISYHGNSNKINDEIWDTIKTKEQTWEGILRNKSKSGISYYVRTIITPFKNIHGEVIEYITVQDNLNTVLDDKKYLFAQIEQYELSILILLQIEEFSMLEKFYNTVTIEQMEKDFAVNLSSYFPKEYSFKNVYTIGNGTFALLTEFNNFDDLQINIEQYLNTFIDNVKNANFSFDDMEFDLNITVSYAIGKYMLYEDVKEGLENALKEKTKVRFSNDSSIIASQEAKENLEMLKTVKIALDNFKIVSYFQPIINNKTKEIVKYESLVRLIDEKGEIISPFHFLNVSKKGNYYNKITQRVLENSFKILNSINTKLSINISSRDIEKEQTREQIFTLLEEHKDDANRIIFELLEDEDIHDFTVIQNFIHTVKSKGVQIAIDDFGTGYSNFERILGFEPDIVKIDGSLVKNIATDKFSRNIVETIVAFAKKQNIETIAEYVESEDIFNILNEIGVDYSQGYFFGKPQEWDESNR